MEEYTEDRRHLNRQVALASLYNYDQSEDFNIDESLRSSSEIYLDTDTVPDQSRVLVETTLENIDEIDRTLSQYLRDWSLDRLTGVDRSILRLATSELLYGDLDPAVVINEAVELVHAFSDQEVAPLVNAVLQSVANAK